MYDFAGGFMKGYAPGWQVRCPKCGLTFDAADLGFTFIGKKLIGKELVLGWCSRCRWLRWLRVEPKPQGAAESTPAAPK
jgi:hypothetical protein